MKRLPQSRRGRVVGACGVATAVLAAGWCYEYRPWEAHFLGRPTSWWERELARPRSPAPWRGWLESFGLTPPGPPARRCDLDLDRSEEGVAVSAELLRSRDPEVRRFAADHLYFVGGKARRALPALLAELGDP